MLHHAPDLVVRRGQQLGAIIPLQHIHSFSYCGIASFLHTFSHLIHCGIHGRSLETHSLLDQALHDGFLVCFRRALFDSFREGLQLLCGRAERVCPCQFGNLACFGILQRIQDHMSGPLCASLTNSHSHREAAFPQTFDLFPTPCFRATHIPI